MMAAAATALMSAMVSGRSIVSNVLVVVGILLVALCNVTPATEAATEPECKGQLNVLNAVVLCHIRTDAKDSEVSRNCPENQGFVVGDLFLTPRSKYDTDCDNYHNTHLLNATCLREDVFQYDETVFDLLDKVSGQHEIESSLEVNRFYFQGENKVNDSSASVAFGFTCKPVKSTDSDSDTVVNMCDSVSVSNVYRVYLTLRDTSDIPPEPSMCRCTVTPTKDPQFSTPLQLKALDLRLQNQYDDYQCGTTSLKITSDGSEAGQDILCHGKEALHGQHILYSSESQDEVTLTLTSVNSTNFPTAAWIMVQQVYSKDATINVTCEGFVPLPTTTKPTVSDPTDRKGGGTGDEDEGGEADEGTDKLPIIIGLAFGSLLLIAIVIAIIIFIRRRYCASSTGEKKSYRPVRPNEPIYAEAGAPDYQFPVDAKFLANGRPEYAEPLFGGTLGAHSGAADPSTPPPLPDQPCPGSPPASAVPPADPFPTTTATTTTFSVDNPPPKPERTLLRDHKKSDSKKSTPKEAEDEEYDHIPSGKMVGQNNNLRQNGKGDDGMSMNVYSHLNHGQDYSHVGFNPKPAVKDNVYDTTS